MTLSRFVRLMCSSSVLALLPACQGKSTTQATPAQTAPATAEAKAPSSGQTPPRTKVEAPPAESEVADPKSLGQHLADPKWFRKTMFGDKGKVLDTKRSTADDQGRFSSLIRFSLTEMTVDACADHLEALVKDEVTTIERETKPDGRVHLSGRTDRFELTFVCGEAKGSTIAFVSYAWT